MKLLIVALLLSLTNIYAKEPACHIEASSSFSTYFNVFVGNDLVRHEVGFNDAYETVSQLILMGQCHPPNPTPKCKLQSIPNYSTISNLVTDKYIILNAVENKDTILRFNQLIEIGLCEGQALP